MLFSWLICAGAAAEANRPNILWIMSDDHAAQGVGAYGGRLAALNPTPTIDRLAREGVRLTNVFCSNSICTPARATLLTGQYSHANGVLTLNDDLKPNQQVLPRLMHGAGYATAMIGKWHLGCEPSAFDYYCVLPGQGTYFNPVFHDKNRGAWPNNQRQMIGSVVGHADAALHVDDATTDISLDWLKKRDRTKPFFLMHHFKSPHGNWENAERYDFLYEDVKIPEPTNLREGPSSRSAATAGLGSSIGKRNPRRNMGQQMSVDPRLPDDSYLGASYQRYLKKYLRCIRGIDDNVARLLTALATSGDLDNTIIVYTSDQGLLTGEHDLYDKRWMYDESMRMPFIVRYPKSIRAGSTSAAMITNVDFAPTLLDFVGVPAPATMQGRSFRTIMEGGPTPAGWQTSVYYRYWMHLAHHDVPAHYGVRSADFKLIFYYGLPLGANGALAKPTPPGWELYDLRSDPEENRNVYAEPKYAATVAALKMELLRLKSAVGDTDEKYPELKRVREKFWQ
jgi:arylsulfatase A-like enzyme